MKNVFISLREWMSEILTKNTTFKKICDLIETAENRAFALYVCAAILYSELTNRQSEFYTIAHKFFRKYSQELMQLSFYADKHPEDLRLTVGQVDVFIDKMADMIEAGCFPESSYEKLATYLHMIFHTGYRSNSLKTKLSEKVTDKKREKE